MNRKYNNRQRLVIAAAVTAFSLMLSACGQGKTPQGGNGSGTFATEEAVSSAATEASSAETASSASSEVSTADASSSEETSSSAESSSDVSSPGDDLIGEWVFVYSNSYTEYSDGDSYSYTTMGGDNDSPDEQLIVRKDRDRLVADFKYDYYESSQKYVGNPLTLLNEPAYEGYEGERWCLAFEDPFATEDSTVMKITASEDDMLMLSMEYRYSSEDFSYHSITENFFLRKGNPKLDNFDDLRYFDTVTVSDAYEMLKEVGENKKIILDEGTYDFSAITEKQLNGLGNEYVSKTYGNTFNIYSAKNFCIEAKEGAKVLIRIDDPYEPVLTFDQCENITVRGITAGHNVEPGYCSGSVLRFTDCYSINIDKCNLFGCGTYGIETSNCSMLNVTDSDIYECTYGLLSMNNTYSAYFKGCTFRDSCDMAMLYLSSVSDISFEDCKFKNNRSDSFDGCFVESYSDSQYDTVMFKNCVFENNIYKKFSNIKVTMENCTMDSN